MDDEGRGLATAKTLKQSDRALAPVRRAPADPSRSVRAARDPVKNQPAFAVQLALLSLYWMARGEDDGLTGADIAAAPQREDRWGQVQAATAAGWGLTCLAIRFLSRPQTGCRTADDCQATAKSRRQPAPCLKSRSSCRTQTRQVGVQGFGPDQFSPQADSSRVNLQRAVGQTIGQP